MAVEKSEEEWKWQKERLRQRSGGRPMSKAIQKYREGALARSPVSQRPSLVRMASPSSRLGARSHLAKSLIMVPSILCNHHMLFQPKRLSVSPPPPHQYIVFSWHMLSLPASSCLRFARTAGVQNPFVAHDLKVGVVLLGGKEGESLKQEIYIIRVIVCTLKGNSPSSLTIQSSPIVMKD